MAQNHRLLSHASVHVCLQIQGMLNAIILLERRQGFTLWIDLNAALILARHFSHTGTAGLRVFFFTAQLRPDD